MYSIHDKGFVYLLIPKKFDTEENRKLFKGNQEEMLYFTFNNGVLIDVNMLVTEGYEVSQAMVDRYGLDNLVANYQRKFKYDFDIFVLKVPQEYLRQDAHFNKGIDSASYNSERIYLPMIYYGNLNGETRKIYPYTMVESVYLHYPDCRRIINDNWTPVCPFYKGMITSHIQMTNLYCVGDEDSRNFENMRYAQRGTRTSSEFADLCEADRQLNEEIGYDPAVYSYLKEKYASFENPYPCKMSRERIHALLSVETDRKAKIERCEFIGG